MADTPETPEATIARLTAERNDALKRLCEAARQLGWWKGAAEGLAMGLDECVEALEKSLKPGRKSETEKDSRRAVMSKYKNLMLNLALDRHTSAWKGNGNA